MFPDTRQFPFDEVCLKILKALEKRNWRVQGLAIEMHETIKQGFRFRKVTAIRGPDFQILFHRIFKPDCQAASRINIPQEELHVFPDESGPLFFYYSGENWEEDGPTFMDENKFTYNKDKMSKKLSRYEGNDCISVSFYRNYYLENAEKIFPLLKTNAVYQDFAEWLNDHVLQKIEEISIDLD